MNAGSGVLHWEMSPFAPPYVKHVDGTQKVYRVQYPVFALTPSSGVLQPDDIAKVSFSLYLGHTYCIV